MMEEAQGNHEAATQEEGQDVTRYEDAREFIGVQE
jgi:hypothetical protein